MVRISTTDAGGRFPELLRLVVDERETVELETGCEVVARMEPVAGRKLSAADLGDFVRSLPPLGDDASAFADDIARLH